MEKQIYHLFIIRECEHKCALCCNRLYDIDQLPVITVNELKNADTVCLTGGEPFLLPNRSLIDLCLGIRKQYPNIQHLYIYTSGGRLHLFSDREWEYLFQYIDGINIAPKSPYEYHLLANLLDIQQPYASEFTEYARQNEKSNRLYVFPDLWDEYEKIKKLLPSTFQVIGRKWDQEFKTPDNEHFVRIPILYQRM